MQCSPTPQESFISACQLHILWALGSTGSIVDDFGVISELTFSFLFFLFYFCPTCWRNMTFWRVETHFCEALQTSYSFSWLHRCKDFCANKHCNFTTLYQICEKCHCASRKNIISVLNMLYILHI